MPARSLGGMMAMFGAVRDGPAALVIIVAVLLHRRELQV
jgi:hypothetical protein